MIGTAIKTRGKRSTGNTAHLNTTVTLEAAWRREIERATEAKVRRILREIRERK